MRMEKMEVKEVGDSKAVKYPQSVYFIVLNQFCERFTYFGILAILPLYFVDILRYNETTATILYHVLSMFANLFPLVSAIIADSWLGKFRTILYISIIYTIGQLLLFASSVPALQLPVREIAILSLLLITFGGGGIKPCISAFGGDQFKLPQQEAHLVAFFSLYYFSVNSGAFLSTILAPILRKDVRCFGQNTCYPLAYLVLTVVIVASGVIFFAGKRFYTVKKPEGNIVFKVTKCTCHALIRKIRSSDKRNHWLDYADDEYDISLIEDLKSVLKVLKLFIPLPIFWALYEQQGSRWTFQATRTNGDVFGYLIKPDQFQVANALFVVILIPIFQFAIYPVIEKFLFINTPLRKLTVGGLLACLSFVISGLVELSLEPTYAIQPSSGLAQVRILNVVNCNGTLTLNDYQYPLGALDVYQNLSIPANGTTKFNLKVQYNDCPLIKDLKYDGTFEAEEAKAFTWFVTKDGISKRLEDKIEKSRSGDPKIRTLIYMDTTNRSSSSELNLDNKRDSYNFNSTGEVQLTDFIEVNHDAYTITLDKKLIAEDLFPKFGGVYTLVGYVSDAQQFTKLVTLAEPNSVHMFWLLPQYIVITMGEIMFSVTGIEFAYSQAPESMKSLLQAGWLLTVALGNLIVIIVAEAEFFDRQVFEFFLFAALMFADMMIFAVMAKCYTYVNIASDKKEDMILQVKPDAFAVDDNLLK